MLCLLKTPLRLAGLAGVVNDALAFYFADAAFAHAFVARFCCGYRVETIAGEVTSARGTLIGYLPQEVETLALAFGFAVFGWGSVFSAVMRASGDGQVIST